MCPLQAGICQTFLKSNLFNLPRKPTGLRSLLCFTHSSMFFLPKSFQSHSLLQEAFQDVPLCTLLPSSELSVMVGKGPDFQSQAGLPAPLSPTQSCEGHTGWTLPSQLPSLRPATQTGAVHGSESSQAFPRKPGCFSIGSHLFLSLREKSQTSPARHPCPPLTSFLHSQNLETRNLFGVGEWEWN